MPVPLSLLTRRTLVWTWYTMYELMPSPMRLGFETVTSSTCLLPSSAAVDDDVLRLDADLTGEGGAAASAAGGGDALAGAASGFSTGFFTSGSDAGSGAATGAGSGLDSGTTGASSCTVRRKANTVRQ